jgi:predicted transcriptional regulator
MGTKIISNLVLKITQDLDGNQVGFSCHLCEETTCMPHSVVIKLSIVGAPLTNS